MEFLYIFLYNFYSSMTILLIKLSTYDKGNICMNNNLEEKIWS